jgi:hypothetical protein
MVSLDRVLAHARLPGRMKARQVVADTFKTISIARRGQGMQDDGVSLDIVLVPHGGQARELRINRKTGEFIASHNITQMSERGK